jgi:hypothetical protein
VQSYFLQEVKDPACISVAVTSPPASVNGLTSSAHLLTRYSLQPLLEMALYSKQASRHVKFEIKASSGEVLRAPAVSTDPDSHGWWLTLSNVKVKRYALRCEISRLAY